MTARASVGLGPTCLGSGPWTSAALRSPISSAGAGPSPVGPGAGRPRARAHRGARPRLNAWAAVDAERALADAAAIDDRLAAGDPVGPLAGIPIGVKDLEPAPGSPPPTARRCTPATRPAEADSPLVARLGRPVHRAGQDHHAGVRFQGDTTSPQFGPTRNPWGVDRSPGGSSGGRRRPSLRAWCRWRRAATAVVDPHPVRAVRASGIKTSQGRVPNGGATPPGSGLFTVKGPMARRIARRALRARRRASGPTRPTLRRDALSSGIVTLDWRSGSRCGSKMPSAPTARRTGAAKRQHIASLSSIRSFCLGADQFKRERSTQLSFRGLYGAVTFNCCWTSPIDTLRSWRLLAARRTVPCRRRSFGSFHATRRSVTSRMCCSRTAPESLAWSDLQVPEKRGSRFPWQGDCPHVFRTGHVCRSERRS